MLETSSNGAEMRALADDMHLAIVTLGGERRASDTRETMIARAARKADISFRQAKSFFYREAINPSAAAVARVQAAMERRNQSQEHRGDCDLISRLEAENLMLRQIIASSLARPQSAAVVEAECGDFGGSATARVNLGGASFSDCALAHAYGVGNQ